MYARTPRPGRLATVESYPSDQRDNAPAPDPDRGAALSGIQAPPAGATSEPLRGPPDTRVRRTIAAMQRVVTDSIRDPAIVAEAARIVQGVDGRDARAQIRAIRAWLAARVRFLADPLLDGDVIRTPSLLLAQLARDKIIQGDCDDIATLTATLGHAVGVPARFVTLAFFGPDSPYSHVYTELLDQHGVWSELDVTESAARRRTIRPTRREEYPATTDAPTGSPLGTLLRVAQLAYVAWRASERLREVMEDHDV